MHPSSIATRVGKVDSIGKPCAAKIAGNSAPERRKVAIQHNLYVRGQCLKSQASQPLNSSLIFRVYRRQQSGRRVDCLEGSAFAFSVCVSLPNVDHEQVSAAGVCRWFRSSSKAVECRFREQEPYVPGPPYLTNAYVTLLLHLGRRLDGRQEALGPRHLGVWPALLFPPPCFRCLLGRLHWWLWGDE